MERNGKLTYPGNHGTLFVSRYVRGITMLFGKKKPSNEPSFPKERLSGLAVDHFVQRYSDGQPGPRGNLRYVMQDGTQTIFSAYKAFQHPEAVDHYKYLLGQTFPYHQSPKVFELKDILFIIDKQNRPILWARSKIEATQFSQIGHLLGYLEKTDYNRPEEQWYFRMPNVEPVIHEDSNF